MINQRIFSANVGDSSVGIAGPDAIEQDIDNLLANDQELLGQINSLDTEVATHKVESTSETKTISRDLQLTGNQITPAFSRKPKSILVFSMVPGTNNFSYAIVDNSGFVKGMYMRSDGTWDGQVGERVVSVRAMPAAVANVTYATLTINSDNTLTLSWNIVNAGATGTVSVIITAFYHGED